MNVESPSLPGNDHAAHDGVVQGAAAHPLLTICKRETVMLFHPTRRIVGYNSAMA